MDILLPFKSLQCLITNRCNYHCRMCDIWKNKETQQLEVEDLVALEGTQLEFASVNGGEPFLHPRCLDFVEFFRDRVEAKMVLLATNGSILPGLEEFAKRFDDVAVSISFDGVNSHTEIRGREDAMDNLMEALHVLRDYQGRRILSFTCQDANRHEIVSSYNFAAREGWEFDFRFVDDNLMYGTTALAKDDETMRQFNWLIEHERDAAKRMFYNGYLNRPSFKCVAGERFVYLLPDGKFYPCLSITKPIGSLKDGVTGLVKCSSKTCWVDCYFYDNFAEQISNIECLDSVTKLGGEDD